MCGCRSAPPPPRRPMSPNKVQAILWRSWRREACDEFAFARQTWQIDVAALALPSTLGRAAALAGFVVLLLHVGAAIANGDSVANDLRTLARTPIYVFWKLKQVPRILRASGGSMPWVRTAREGEAKQHA